MSEIDLVKWRENIGLVSQEPTLFSTTIAENIRMGQLDASEGEIRKACEVANAMSFVQNLPKLFC